MLINIHSHHPASGNEFVIENKYGHFDTLLPGNHYSIGLHPWHISESTYFAETEELRQYSKNNNVLGIGECGLDKICNTDFTLQQKVFAAQIVLANNIQKPLIIHCVRAYDEVQQLLEQHHNNVPVIFHGFNKNKTLAQQLINKGYYLSIGKVLQLPAMQQLIELLPLDKIFFETDDAAVDIASIYSLAAEALHIDINSLSLQVQKNAATIFGAANF